VPTLSDMDTMETLRADLERARGRWPKIAAETGIDYFTIARIARGNTESPRIDTVMKIQGWIRDNLPATSGAAA